MRKIRRNIKRQNRCYQPMRLIEWSVLHNVLRQHLYLFFFTIVTLLFSCDYVFTDSDFRIFPYHHYFILIACLLLKSNGIYKMFSTTNKEHQQSKTGFNVNRAVHIVFLFCWREFFKARGSSAIKPFTKREKMRWIRDAPCFQNMRKSQVCILSLNMCNHNGTLGARKNWKKFVLQAVTLH